MCLYKYWVIPDKKPKKPACFIVLSYGVKDALSPNKPTKSVIRLAYKWWKKFPRKKIILSTGDNQGLGVANAKVMADYAVKIGIPRKNIIEEDKSLNTYENLLFSRKIVKDKSLKNPTLVALDLHMRRSLATAKRIGWRDLCWLSSYSKGGSSYGKKCLQTYSRLTIFIYEVLAYFYSLLVGWV
jgi:uncharacterized SAM-binding protein YcdF (DUF218 family)